MPSFAVGQSVETREPVVSVDAGLPVGRHRFQLVVRDAAGNASPPVTVTVAVQVRVVPPLEPLEPVRPVVPVVPVVPPIVPITPVTPITPTRPRGPVPRRPR